MHADLDLDQQTIESVTYGKKGTELTNTTDVETLDGKGGTAQTPASGTTANVGVAGATSAAGGTSKYSHKQGDTTFGVDKTVESKSSCPARCSGSRSPSSSTRAFRAAQVASLQDAVSRARRRRQEARRHRQPRARRFGKQEPVAAVEPGPLDAAGGPLGMAKWVGLGLGALLFLFFVRRGLKRREGEALGLEPTWLREITESRPLAELESRPRAIPTCRPRPAASTWPSRSRRSSAASPRPVANQVTQWMRE